MLKKIKIKKKMKKVLKTSEIKFTVLSQNDPDRRIYQNHAN